jgi:hypothetical protein
MQKIKAANRRPDDAPDPEAHKTQDTEANHEPGSQDPGKGGQHIMSPVLSGTGKPHWTVWHIDASDHNNHKAAADHNQWPVGFTVSTHQAGADDEPNPSFAPEEPERRLAGTARSLFDLPLFAEDPFVFLEPQTQERKATQ